MRAIPLFNPARLLGVAGLAGLLAAALLIFSGGGPRPPATLALSAATPASPEIEAAWGVRIDHVALIGGGGIIDVRYTVVDPDRAAALLVSLDALPVITNQRSGAELRLTEALHHRVNLDAGRSYYMLYANAGNLLRRGDAVSLTVGEFTLAPVVVK